MHTCMHVCTYKYLYAYVPVRIVLCIYILLNNYCDVALLLLIGGIAVAVRNKECQQVRSIHNKS